jgi:Methyltransferase domain
VRHAKDQLALNEGAGTLASDQLFDTIGVTYAATRPTEPRIAARIWAALGDARTVVNVGAGTGSYEPPDREVTAVEPSAVMRAQRPAGAAPCVGGLAGSLPFADQSFDAAMAVSTDQHWPNAIAGYREMRRVARRVVTFHFDISRLESDFWLIRDYLPEHRQLSAGRPTLTERARAIGARLEPVPIPWDCCDGNFPSYWRRPEAYLDEQVRGAVSVWHAVGPAVEERVARDLRADLESGRWVQRNSELLDLDEIDLGGRLLIA